MFCDTPQLAAGSFIVGTFSATDSAFLTDVGSNGGSPPAPGGAVTIQGLQGSGDSAHSVSLTNTTVSTFSMGLPNPPGAADVRGGPIVIRADKIDLTQSAFYTFSAENIGGAITLVGKNRIETHDSTFSANSFFSSGGLIDFEAGKSIDLTNTSISTHGFAINGGNITMSAPRISIGGSTLDAGSSSGGAGHGGTISITGEKAVSLSGTVLTADALISGVGALPQGGHGGTILILINGGSKFTSEQSTLSAKSAFGNGGTIHIEANKVGLTDTQVTTSVSGGPQTVGGSITVDAKNVTLKNSEILSTATEGHGGTIGITTHKLHSANSVIDATSQFGTDGTVTIERP